jgi:hypothetical protein
MVEDMPDKYSAIDGHRVVRVEDVRSLIQQKLKSNE